MLNLKDKKVSVLGGGESGLQSALLLEKRGACVFLSEMRSRDEMPEAYEALSHAGIKCEFGTHSWDRIRSSDLIIISPGISPGTEIYMKALASGIPTWSEIEF